MGSAVTVTRFGVESSGSGSIGRSGGLCLVQTQHSTLESTSSLVGAVVDDHMHEHGAAGKRYFPSRAGGLPEGRRRLQWGPESPSVVPWRPGRLPLSAQSSQGNFPESPPSHSIHRSRRSRRSHPTSRAHRSRLRSPRRTTRRRERSSAHSTRLLPQGLELVACAEGGNLSHSVRSSLSCNTLVFSRFCLATVV